jgi:hypothetical protein
MLTEDDKEFIRTYVAEVTSEEEKKERRRECANSYNVSIPTVAAITAWTKIRENRTTLVTKPIELVSCTEDGCNANYDNPTKQAWRNKWKDFLAKNTALYEREKMRVLCLPGRKCLEIPLYLELGFKPGNIVGVEGGDEQTKMEFCENAYRYGISTRLGRLEKFIEDEYSTYDVISLDFTGPLSRTTLDIIKNLPLAPKPDSSINTKSFLMVNFLGKREVEQGFIDFYASLTNPELMDMFKPHMELKQFEEVFNYMSDLQTKVINGDKVYESLALKEKRNKALPMILSSLLCRDRRRANSIWTNYYEKIPLRIQQEGFSDVATEVLMALINKIADQKTAEALFVGLPQLIEVVTGYKPFVYDLQEYQYISPVNNASAPFLTEMLMLYTPMEEYVKARYFIRFLMNAVFWKAENDGLILCEVRNKHGKIPPYNIPLDKKDSISFVSADGAVISSCTFGKIMDAYTSLMTHILKDKIVEMMFSGKSYRELIN